MVFEFYYSDDVKSIFRHWQNFWIAILNTVFVATQSSLVSLYSLSFAIPLLCNIVFVVTLTETMRPYFPPPFDCPFNLLPIQNLFKSKMCSIKIQNLFNLSKIQNLLMFKLYTQLGQLYGPNRDKKCWITAIRSKNCSKTAKIENMTVSHSLLCQLYGPEYTMQSAWQRKKWPFFRWCDVTGPSVKFNMVVFQFTLCDLAYVLPLICNTLRPLPMLMYIKQRCKKCISTYHNNPNTLAVTCIPSSPLECCHGTTKNYLICLCNMKTRLQGD